jgi:membrane-associated protease RseP (regulator of RpoE activity)
MSFRNPLLALTGSVVLAANLLGVPSDAQAQGPAPFQPYVAPRTLGVYVVSANGGLQVNYVVPNSPAAHANIRAGDVITSVGNQPVYFPTDISRHLRVFLAQNPFGSVPVVILRWQHHPYFGWIRVSSRTAAPFNSAGVPQYLPTSP